MMHNPNSNMQKPRGTFIRNDDGVAAVEFAIISVLFLTLLFAIVEASRAMWAQNTLAFALEEAARERIVDDTMTDTDVSDMVITRMTGLIDTSTVNVTITTSTTTDGVEIMNITGTFDYQMLLPLLPRPYDTIQLSAATHMPL